MYRIVMLYGDYYYYFNRKAKDNRELLSMNIISIIWRNTRHTFNLLLLLSRGKVIKSAFVHHRY